MDEVIALESEIRDALPALDAAAALFDRSAPIPVLLAFAQDILCNGWNAKTSTRLERLRAIAADVKLFRKQMK
jgi:hypothetical protein